MLNINTGLIRETLPSVGSDAYAVMHVIASHLGSNGSRIAWPGLTRIRNMATIEKNGEIVPMPIKRCQAAIRRLISEGCLERWQERKNGDFGKTKYKLTTRYIGIYMGVSEFEMEENEEEPKKGEKTVQSADNQAVPRKVVFGVAQNGVAENDATEGINNLEGINKKEDITKNRNFEEDLICPNSNRIEEDAAEVEKDDLIKKAAKFSKKREKDEAKIKKWLLSRSKTGGGKLTMDGLIENMPIDFPTACDDFINYLYNERKDDFFVPSIGIKGKPVNAFRGFLRGWSAYYMAKHRSINKRKGERAVKSEDMPSSVRALLSPIVDKYFEDGYHWSVADRDAASKIVADPAAMNDFEAMVKLASENTMDENRRISIYYNRWVNNPDLFKALTLSF